MQEGFWLLRQGTCIVDKNMITIEKAFEIAAKAHRGQTDLEGKPYILHPMRVASMGETREEVVAGLLHDVVEDTSCSFDDLCVEGVDAHIIDVLRLLTHHDDESYDDYIGKIASSGNRTAIKVKLNDLTHNLERGRAHGHAKLVAKHEKALQTISDSLQNI